MIKPVNPSIMYIRRMALRETEAARIMQGNPFILGGNPSMLSNLGRSGGESFDGTPATFVYHPFVPPLTGLRRFEGLLRATAQTIPASGSERQRVNREVRDFATLLSEAEVAYRALPPSYLLETPPDGIKEKDDRARRTFEALQGFLGAYMGLAMIAMRRPHNDDLALTTYFDLDRGAFLMALGINSFPF